jgi:transcriptional regulator with XRE-family HTH domain
VAAFAVRARRLLEIQQMADVAAALRRARQSKRLTQAQVGRLLEPPLDHSLISRYEAGLKVPASTLVQLARVLHLDVTLADEEVTV